ncbi:hypothetical protein Tdes44962_MAKER04128 [Teratosphaeria destructans]|uniref:Uncharacterized protein n=1 Tax=Teratosphaeria destructans TaxID=418781 RepID=A0A9W7SMX6_9PEZI|nr:hypothetical protein Tdes44962_MAKER04128 [Teratosphaeria destructans]
MCLMAVPYCPTCGTQAAAPYFQALGGCSYATPGRGGVIICSRSSSQGFSQRPVAGPICDACIARSVASTSSNPLVGWTANGTRFQAEKISGYDALKQNTTVYGSGTTSQPAGIGETSLQSPTLNNASNGSSSARR